MNKQDRLKQDHVIGEPVLFYHQDGDFGCFSNFSDHSVVLRNPWTGAEWFYPTGEHRYQAMKATNEEDHNYVAAAPNPFESKKRGGPGEIELRPDWGDDYNTFCFYVMLENVLAKTLQHPEVQEELFGTFNRTIYEDSPTDDIWGWRYRNDYRGKNLLGIAWMQTREMLT